MNSLLVKHVQALASDHGISAYYAKSRTVREARSRPALRKAYLPYVTDDVTYFTALHEFGHLVLGHTYGLEDEPEDELAREVEAWIWALCNGLVKPSAAVSEFIIECLVHYAYA